ncbi:MAG: hypothetical protein IT353_02935 [Gemmatimonadaceae bacterium]|nr:hypothetical protein [Gemmatimonadaceae bacterium]
MPTTTPVRIFGVSVALVAIGAIVGAFASIPLTMLGKVVAGAEPAILANFLWNAGVFGVLGAIGGPLLTWSALRHAPLWRAMLEPALGALAGAVLGSIIGGGVGFLVLTPIGLAAASWRLQRTFPTPARPIARGLDDSSVSQLLSRNQHR